MQRKKEKTVSIIFVFEIVGIISFAFSGALVAIDRKLDLFGIIVLSVTTAVGGGMFRDILIGNIPPVMFVYPVYTIVSVLTALSVMLTYKYLDRIMGSHIYSYLYLILDAIGLGIFTVVGVNVCIMRGFVDNAFLSIFVGVISGVGGGLVRDVLVNRTPLVLKKEIYAVASLIGAGLYYFLQEIVHQNTSIYISVLVIFFIRMVAVKNNINLPYVGKK